MPATLESKRREFEESNYTQNISLFSDRADIKQLKQAQHKLEQLKKDILTNESNHIVRHVYSDAIDWTHESAAMIIAGTVGDRESFRRTNTLLYDKPDEQVFKAVCHWIRHDAEQTQAGPDSHLNQLAERVLKLIPDVNDNHQMLVPSEKVFKSVKQSHHGVGGYYDLLFGPNGMPTDAYIDQIKGDEICQTILENIGSDFTIATSENNIWAIMPSRKQLVRPAGYRLDRDEFIGIVCHEIGSHILEVTNGSKYALQLLSTGLAGYEKGNEGRAFLREQIVYENEHTFLQQFAWEYIALLHLSVCMASGTYKRPYTFSELYDVLFSLYLFWRERRLPLATNNEAFAHDEAWYLTVRIMKGTDGLGGAYMKDTVYLEGNIRCWKVAATDPQLILLGDQGKFDITNNDHLEVFRTLLSDNSIMK